MAKAKSIKTIDLEQYDGLDLHQLEALVAKQQELPESNDVKQTIRTIKQAIRNRLRFIKSAAMEHEEVNDRYLILFDSTDGYCKIGGHSVLFYTLTMADRLHRRFSLKNDSDDYFRSEEGIVSIRDRVQLEAQLANIDVHPDPEHSTSELHFYRLSRIYTDEQIAKLHDRSCQDVARITSIIIPKSPVPELYAHLLELNRLVYYNCKKIPDGFARQTLLARLIDESNSALESYLNFANARASAEKVRPELLDEVKPLPGLEPRSTQAQCLYNLLLHVRSLRNNMANIENLRLLHHRELCQILESIVEIERITAREYNKQIRADRKAREKAERDAAKDAAKDANNAKDTNNAKDAPDQPTDDKNNDQPNDQNGQTA